jgi:hypothetical protein
MCHSSGRNPNVQYPYERINLPSNGQCYTNSLSSGKINLYPLTAKHEDILCSPGLYKDYHHFDLILNDIIENDDVDINELLQVDVEGILLASKMLSFGPKQKIGITCPHCDEKDEYIINLSQYKPIEAIIPKDKVYPYKSYRIHFGLLTYEVFKKSNTNTELIKNLIVKILDDDGNELDIDYFMKNIFLYRDYKNFTSFLNKSFPTITPEIYIPCTSCDKSMKLPFKFDRGFFGMDGGYKINLHKEILAILYSANGGLTHSDIYNMPVSLRMVYTNELMDIKKKEKENMKQTEDAPSSIARPPIPQ